MFWIDQEDLKKHSILQILKNESKNTMIEYGYYFIKKKLAKFEIQDVNARKWLGFLWFDLGKNVQIEEKIINLKQNHINDNIEKYLFDEKKT